MDRSICPNCHRTNPVEEVYPGKYRTECSRCGITRTAGHKEDLGCISGYHCGSATKAAKPAAKPAVSPVFRIRNPFKATLSA